MHEYGLSEGVLDAVQKRADGRPVAGIRIRCGARHAVEPEAMRQAFGMMATGTEADLIPRRLNGSRRSTSG